MMIDGETEKLYTKWMLNITKRVRKFAGQEALVCATFLENRI